jgi:hypothetical protein
MGSTKTGGSEGNVPLSVAFLAQTTDGCEQGPGRVLEKCFEHPAGERGLLTYAGLTSAHYEIWMMLRHVGRSGGRTIVLCQLIVGV